MKKIGKKLLGIILSIVMLIGVIPVSQAITAQEAADDLHDQGLFGGIGTDANGNPIYDLERTPNRQEAITMLVTLIGKNSEAREQSWEMPFTDVDDWAKPFVGYAYAHGLTAGISDTAYGGCEPVTACQYLTFVLNALGYSSATDFQWDKAWELSDKLGLTHGEYSQNKKFLRGDVALISRAALYTEMKGSSCTLQDKLFGTQTEPEPVQKPEPEQKDDEITDMYILNINSKKFHYPTCPSVKRMKESNKRVFSGSRDELIAQGYQPCHNCNP